MPREVPIMRVLLRGEVVQPGLCCSPRVPVETWKQCLDVGLVDGSVPVIGKHEATITGLEPAVWFKVLVVDTVCIDFITNTIQWTTCCYRNCAQRIMGDRIYQRCKHTHECLLNEDYYLPDIDLHRGLDLAKQILLTQNEDHELDLLHLLHVYILPIIKLHSEDKEQVAEALTNQKLILGKLDAKIDEMSSQRTEIKQNMRVWREDICRGLQTEKDIVSCNTSFLKLLCRHLESDIQNSYVELDTCQKKVEEAKLKVQRKEEQHCISRLNKARTARDKVADRITKSLYVVEEVGLMIRLSKTPDSQQLSDMHSAYIKIQDDWEGHTKELTELQRKKICATSVREALVNTELELAVGGETTGVEISSDGMSRSTDVLGQSSLPSGWETLQSQVAKSLELNSVIQELHGVFSRWMRQYLSSELGNQPATTSWREKIPTCNLQCTQVEESANVTCLKISPNNFSQLRQSIKERKPATHYQGITKTLQNEVFLHFQDVVDQLVKDPAVPSTCFSRLWTSYERCFFSSRSRDILSLYERAYAVDSKKVKRLLSKVTIRDLDLDDEWILNILGLYAPDFPSSVPEEGEEIREETGEKLRGETGEELSKEIEKETSEQKVGDVVTDEDGETKSRERLESGIDLQGVDVRIVTLRESGNQGRHKRGSNRYTRIIDLTWVTGPTPEAAKATWSDPSERSSTWSGLDWQKRKSQGKMQPKDRLSTSVPSIDSDSVFSAGHSLPIDIPNTNSNARTLSIPIASSVGDSGVCLNITKDSDFSTGGNKDAFGPSQLEPSSADSNDPLEKRCQDNPNTRVFLERFQTAYNCFRIVIQDTVPMSKLQWLYKCIQEVNTTAEKQSQLIFCGKPRMLSGDDLLTSLILFLLHGNVDEVANGYYHIMLLQDYLPTFLDKGHFGFTVIQFLLAYSYILDHEEKDSCA